MLILALLITADWKSLEAEARTAINERDYAALRVVLLQEQPLAPTDPRIIYNLAAANAILGNKAAAAAGIERLVDMGLVYAFTADADFASIKTFPTAKLKANTAKIGSAKQAFTVDETLVEDIAHDGKRFLLTATKAHKIVADDGKTFATTTLEPMAIVTDGAHNRVWVTEAEAGKTALLGFDGRGVLQQRVPATGLFGDICLSEHGDVYVSEGKDGGLFLLPAGGTGFTRLDSPGDLISPQTPALSADGSTLYVPDYVRGVAALDLKTKALRFLAPPNIALTGIDGLYRSKDGFIAVQNGTHPARVMWFSPDFERSRVLEANWPGVADATHGTFVGDAFYFIADAGWEKRSGPARVMKR